jgi:hypothetical protein
MVAAHITERESDSQFILISPCTAHLTVVLLDRNNSSIRRAPMARRTISKALYARNERPTASVVAHNLGISGCPKTFAKATIRLPCSARDSNAFSRND